MLAPCLSGEEGNASFRCAAGARGWMSGFAGEREDGGGEAGCVRTRQNRENETETAKLLTKRAPGFVTDFEQETTENAELVIGDQ